MNHYCQINLNLPFNVALTLLNCALCNASPNTSTWWIRPQTFISVIINFWCPDLWPEMRFVSWHRILKKLTNRPGVSNNHRFPWYGLPSVSLPFSYLFICKWHKTEQFQIKASISDERALEIHACQGMPRTRPHCLIIVCASPNCPCFGQCRKLNVISCVQHVALWLWLDTGLCIQGWTFIKHVKSGPDRNLRKEGGSCSFMIWWPAPASIK